ncbi:MAG TPA: glycosyltransferase family 39 protein [Pirellulales bacterium]|nr:glycosyltransferase family 39 protein [Pirellulales bacterium]
MSESSRDRLWIVVVGACVLLTQLGATTFWDEDETLYAEIVREMIERSDWTVPLYNGQLVTDKPPMVYWLMIAGIRTLGESELAARLAFALLGIATALLTYDLGTLLYNRRAGMWAAIALVSNIIFDVSARACTPDSPLVFFTVAALWCYVRGGGLMGAPLRPATAVAMYGCMGLGMLTKGPVAFVLPVGLLMLFHLLRAKPSPLVGEGVSAATADEPGEGMRRFSPRRLWQVGWSLRPITAIIVITVVAAPWFIAVGLRTDGQWLTSFFVEHNAMRFLKPNMGHKGPIFYHPLTIMIGFFPWSVFLPLALVALGTRIVRGDAWAASDKFVACWAGAYIVFFSLSKTKLPNYVLPAYPALALMTGALIDGWLRQAVEVAGRWITIALASTALVGAGATVVLGIGGLWFIGGDYRIGMIGVAPALGGAIAWWLHRQQRRQASLAAFGVAAVLFVMIGFGVVGPIVNQYHNAPTMVAEWREKVAPDTRLVAYCDLCPSQVYYAGREVPCFRDSEQVRQFFASSPDSFLLVRSNRYSEVASVLPDDMRVIDRRARFLKKGEFLLLGRPETLVASAGRTDR